MKETKKGMISMRVNETMADDFKNIADELGLSQSETLRYFMKKYREFKPTWISLKDKLPPVDETVLMLVKYGGDDEAYVLGYLEFYEYKQIWVLRDEEYNDISAIAECWLPIPPIKQNVI